MKEHPNSTAESLTNTKWSITYQTVRKKRVHWYGRRCTILIYRHIFRAILIRVYLDFRKWAMSLEGNSRGRGGRQATKETERRIIPMLSCCHDSRRKKRRSTLQFNYTSRFPTAIARPRCRSVPVAPGLPQARAGFAAKGAIQISTVTAPASGCHHRPGCPPRAQNTQEWT